MFRDYASEDLLRLRTRLVALALACAVLFWPLELRAQDSVPSLKLSGADSSHSLAGVVLDPSGAAIGQASVLLRSERGGEIQQSLTDATGTFRFEKLQPGKYQVELSAQGFRSAHLPVVMTNRRALPLKIVLRIEVQTENVTVASGENVPLINTESTRSPVQILSRVRLPKSITKPDRNDK